MSTNVRELLGSDADSLLLHKAKVPAERLLLPGADYVDRAYALSDRPTPVLRNLQALFGHGRLAGTGYLSILPVDQGIEHSAGASFAPNPDYFDPENIVKLAIEGGCNAVASTLGVLGAVARKYAHRIPFIMKLNHNEFLTYPNKFDQIMFGRVKQAFDMGAVAVGATVYFGSPESDRHATTWPRPTPAGGKRGWRYTSAAPSRRSGPPRPGPISASTGSWRAVRGECCAMWSSTPRFGGCSTHLTCSSPRTRTSTTRAAPSGPPPR